VNTRSPAAAGPGRGRQCVACGAGELEPHFAVAGEAGDEGLVPSTDRFGSALADVVRCRACGHMQLERFPSEARLERAYSEAASADYLEEEAGQRATACAVLDAMERHVPRGRLLDLGCWVGYLLSEAQARGWNTVGVEPSEFASRYARERLGLDVRTAALFEAELPGSAFEAVVLGDVIEHLPHADAALDRIATLLAPGGVVAMALPDAGSRVARALGARWWSVIPTHVHYFTRHSIRVLLERRGYRVLSIATSPKAFTVRYYLGRIGGYSPRLGRALVSGAQRAGIAERVWAPDFRDRMLVLARHEPGSAGP
jgi:2-polyprenyl-3-methyl-5-hydroxy-6-metoxy-1,4-benzoquinol methylase